MTNSITFVSSFMNIYDRPYDHRDMKWILNHFSKHCRYRYPYCIIHIILIILYYLRTL